MIKIKCNVAKKNRLSTIQTKWVINIDSIKMISEPKVVIKSKTNNVEGTNLYFEQRANSKEEEKSCYFNQPVVMVPIDEKNKSMIKDIVKNMRASIKQCGVGLAHSQYPKQDGATNPYSVFIIEGKGISSHVPFEAFINPVIVGYSIEKVGFYHGCLSAIGVGQAKVSTYKEILIAFFSENLVLQVKRYTDMAAVICQHEFNHLATCGTYVDTVNVHINGDRFRDAKEFYLDTKEIKKMNEYRKIIEPFAENVPCLINGETLTRCKRFLMDNKLYDAAIAEYLQNYPEDKPLYNNLINVSDSMDSVSQLYVKAIKSE